MRYIDICVNLDNSQFNDDRAEVLERSHDAGVSAMLLTATNLASARQLIEWCDAPHIRCTAGIHPHDASDAEPGWIDELAELAALDAVRAIGETGLDFNRNFSPPDVQLAVFREQIALAARIGKPLFVHDRESNGAVYEALSEQPNLPPTVVHCFTGNAADLTAYLNAGFYIGITGWVADTRRGAQLRELVAKIPLSRLLLETDAPFLRPHNAPADNLSRHGLPRRLKRRNEPALIPYVCTAVAECYGIEAEEVAAASVANAQQLFSF